MKAAAEIIWSAFGEKTNKIPWGRPADVRQKLVKREVGAGVTGVNER